MIDTMYPPSIEEEEVEMLQPLRWTVDTYCKLAEAGFLAEEDVELIDGEILVKMAPQGNRHMVSVTKTEDALRAAFGDGFVVFEEKHIRISDDSMPEPDLMVVRGPVDTYAERSVWPTDVELLVEVSDSSIAFDRQTKARLYSDAGVPEYWIVDLAKRQVELHRQPAARIGYRSITYVGVDESVTPLRASAAIPVTSLLPLAPPTKG